MHIGWIYRILVSWEIQRMCDSLCLKKTHGFFLWMKMKQTKIPLEKPCWILLDPIWIRSVLEFGLLWGLFSSNLCFLSMAPCSTPRWFVTRLGHLPTKPIRRFLLFALRLRARRMSWPKSGCSTNIQAAWTMWSIFQTKISFWKPVHSVNMCRWDGRIWYGMTTTFHCDEDEIVVVIIYLYCIYEMMVVQYKYVYIYIYVCKTSRCTEL